MILQGNQRGGASDLARHLLKDENEHVTVHELRGFVSDDLKGALNEAYAVSKATKASQFLYSLSVNPPQNEKVSTEAFEDAINRVEKKLGLENQPRAIVFHEKKGRRHAHAVWSRTNTQTMTAVHLPHTKRKLMELSRDLYIAHGWDMPKGMLDPNLRDPRNFTLAQWQQAKRIGKDPKAIKQAFQDSWAISDDLRSFSNALKERGYFLAKGDRRGFVAVDQYCEVYAVSKWVGVKVKEVRAKLGQESDLPSVPDTKVKIAREVAAQLTALDHRQAEVIGVRIDRHRNKHDASTEKHRSERKMLASEQESRWIEEARARQARYRKGLKGIMDRVTGRHRQIRRENEQELAANKWRDQTERDDMVHRQLEERRATMRRIDRLKQFRQDKSRTLDEDRAQYQEIIDGKREKFDRKLSVRHEM